MTEPQRQRRQVPPGELLKLLRHPLRRRLVRLFLAHKEALSPAELAKTLGVSTPGLSYHIRCLADAGVIYLAWQNPAGRQQRFYLLVPGSLDAPLVTSVLSSTSEDA